MPPAMSASRGRVDEEAAPLHLSPPPETPLSVFCALPRRSPRQSPRLGHPCKLCGHQGCQANWRLVAGTPKPVKTLSSGVCEGGHNARPALWLLLPFSHNARESTETTANRAKQSHPLCRRQPAPDSHAAAAHCSLPVPCQRTLQA